MPLTVRAQVVDLTQDTPTNTDRFLVDTNVWRWLHYPPASQSASPYQVKDYPAYIGATISAGAKLFCTALTFSELAHTIEASELAIHNSKQTTQIELKQFRHNCSNQRPKVVTAIRDTWLDVLSMSEVLPITLDATLANDVGITFSNIAVDGYDLYMIEAMRANGVTQVITDDSDYITVNGITVFTANQRAIREAVAAGKLIQRP